MITFLFHSIRQSKEILAISLTEWLLMNEEKKCSCCRGFTQKSLITKSLFTQHFNFIKHNKGSQSPTCFVIFDFPVIMWRKHYYPLLCMSILNSQTCNLFVHRLTLNATKSWNSSSLLCFELFLTDFSYSPRHVFIFKTNQNIMFGLHRIIYLHLLALRLYSIYKLPVQSGKHLHFYALIQCTGSYYQSYQPCKWS